MWLLLSCAATESSDRIDSAAGDEETGVDTGDDTGDETWWTPSPGVPWQIQYTGRFDFSLDVNIWDLDLFDISDADIASVRSNGKLLCYFSAGSYEDWRADAADFPPEALGEPLDGWEGEWWIDVTNDAVRAIMADRIADAAARGCDGVDPDNVNGWENPTGLRITEAQQVDFNRFLADTAHANGLAIALKNDQSQLPELADWFDLAVNEECATWDECEAYDDFVAAGKPVLHIEYVDDWSEAESRAAEVCDDPQVSGLETLIKTLELGAEYLACDG